MRMVLPFTLFPGSILLAGPKHSTTVPSSEMFAVTLSVDVKEELFDPKPVSDVAVNISCAPQIEEEFILCTRVHSLLPATFQVVTPFMSPITVQLKVKVSPGQVGGAALNCPATSPVAKYSYYISAFLCVFYLLPSS